MVFSPYQQLFSFARDAHVGVDCAQRAYSHLNDSYRTTVCLTHTPTTIAVACLQLALNAQPLTAEEGERSAPAWVESLDVDLQTVSVPLFLKKQVSGLGAQAIEPTGVHNHSLVYLPWGY